MLKALILASGIPSALAYTVVGPMLAKISAALARGPADAYMVKMISGVLGPAMVVGGVLGGVLADKAPRRTVMVASSFIVAGAGLAPAVLDSLPAILVTRFIMGMVAVIISTIGVVMVGDYFDEAQRPSWMGAVVAVDLVAAIVALPTAGLIADTGWRWPFLMYACGFPIAALAFVSIPAGVAAYAHSPAPEDAASSGGVRYPVGLITLGLIIGALVTTPGIYISFYFRGLGLEKPSTVGVILMLNATVAVVVASVFGRVRRRFSSGAIFCCSFGAMAIGITVLALAPSYQIAVGALLIMGAGMGWLNPNLMSAVIETAEPSHRGRALGAVRASSAMAPALGVTALQPVVERIGVNGAYLLTAGIAAMMFIGTAARAVAIRPAASGEET
jgi:MFS family permease